MNCKRFLKLNAALCLLALAKTVASQECDSNELNCITCTEYRTCNAGVPQGNIVSCKNGNDCGDDNLRKCQMKFNCYAVREADTSTVPPTTTTPTTVPPTTTTPTTVPPTTTTPTTVPPTTTTPTTVSPTTTTPTAVPPTTTTPEPTTTTSTTTTTTTTTAVPPTTPFTCPMAGVYENPLDCKTYYRCSTSLKVFRYVCPGRSYFNEIIRRCSLNISPRCQKLIQG